MSTSGSEQAPSHKSLGSFPAGYKEAQGLTAENQGQSLNAGVEGLPGQAERTAHRAPVKLPVLLGQVSGEGA